MPGKYERKDHLYEKAKDTGLRSRAAFKLSEIDKKFKIFKRGFKILDLGAWPGGWLQVAGEAVGSEGLVVGIDLKQIEDLALSNIKVLCGDVREESLIQEALRIAGAQFDVLLSDMSPKLTGVREIDQIACVGCAELALWGASLTLKSGGTFIAKVFKSQETEGFVKSTRPLFNKLVREELDSSRKTSNEFYLIGLGYKGLGQREH